MEAVLNKSRTMCPFLKKTSPSTLRTLSTSAAKRHVSSATGGAVSNLQVLARRCPIMGKALAVQSSRSTVGRTANAVFGGSFASYSTGKARIHTTRSNEAQAVNGVGLFENETRTYFDQYYLKTFWLTVTSWLATGGIQESRSL
jgi:5-aminolevulinate synthase